MWIQSTVDNWGVSRGRSVAAGVGDRWKVTCDLSHVTHIFFFTKRAKKVTTSVKNAKKWLKTTQKCKKVAKKRDFI